MSSYLVRRLGWFLLSGCLGFFVRIVLGDRPLPEHVLAIVMLNAGIVGLVMLVKGERDE